MSSEQLQLDMLVVGKLFQKFKELVGFDKRSIALFRVFIAITTLYDLADRARDIQAHYTDDGIFPRSLMYANYWNNQWISIYTMGGTVWCQSIVFAVNALFALLLLVGWWTRTMTVVNWFFVVSLQSRNIFVGHGGDVLHRVVLFFAVFLPLGDYYSVDAALASRKKSQKMKKNSFVWNVATFTMTIQILVMYISAHTLKTGREWREIGTATFLALQLDFFRRPFGDFLLMLPTLCKWSTFGVLHWQFWGSVLYFSPFFTGPCKTFSAFGFFMMHVGFFAALRLGQFGWVTCSAVLILLPPYFWDNIMFSRTIGLRRFKRFTQFTLYYQPGCQFCTTMAKYIKTFFLLEDCRIRPADAGHNGPCRCGERCHAGYGPNPSASNQYSSDKNAHASDSEDFVVDVKASRTIRDTHGSNGNHYGNHGNSKHYYNNQGVCWVACVDHNGKLHENFDALIAVCYASPLLFYLAPLLSKVKNMGNTIMTLVHDHDDEIPLAVAPFYSNSYPDSSSTEESADRLQLPLSHRQSYQYHSASDATSASDGEAVKGNMFPHRREFRVKRRKPLAYKVAKMTWRISSIIMVNALVSVLLWTIITWNAASIGLGRYTGYFHQSVLNIIWATHLDQNWSMFAPRPPDIQWWYNIEATLDDGTKAELFRNGCVYDQCYNDFTWDKPDPFHWSFKNHRWFKYYENGFNMATTNTDLRLNLGRWICREFNKVHSGPKRLYQFSIHWMNEWVDTNKLDGTRHPRPKQTLWNHICYNK